MKLYEVFDLYDLYKNPEELPGYADRHEKVPQLAWQKYYNEPIVKVSFDVKRLTDQQIRDLKLREHLWMQDPTIAYKYACFIRNGRFPEGEEVISKSPFDAYLYARDIIEGRWIEGEPAILSDNHIAKLYARDINISDKQLKQLKQHYGIN